MADIKLLDCTLRDGGYVNNWQWGFGSARRIIQTLTRAGVDIVKHEEGSDPAAVVFDSIQAAKARGTDVVIIDTAGRLHNKTNLMNELNKITRVIRRELPEADIETLMVLDATTGQNGLIQAKQFLDTADLTGIVLTKLDGTAKGGIVFAIAMLALFLHATKKSSTSKA